MAQIMASDDAELMALTDVALGEAEADIAFQGTGDFGRWLLRRRRSQCSCVQRLPNSI